MIVYFYGMIGGIQKAHFMRGLATWVMHDVGGRLEDKVSLQNGQWCWRAAQ